MNTNIINGWTYNRENIGDNLKEGTIFQKCTFTGIVFDVQCTFLNCTFDDCSFTTEVSAGANEFGDCTFYDNVDLNDCWIRNCEFKKPGKFYSCEMWGTVSGSSKLTSCKIANNGDSEFGSRCEFNDCKFFGKNTKFANKCEFTMKTVFMTGAEFGHGCKFGGACKFGPHSIFGVDCTFGPRCEFGTRCCFTAPMTYIEYVERTNIPFND